MHSHRTFIPAAGHDVALPFYDSLTWLLGASAVHRALIEQAGLQPGQRTLEIGCGTGNLTLLTKRACPTADVHALDPDPRALAIAARKARRAGLSVHLERAFAESIPTEAARFDSVLSAFMFHHLDEEAQAATLVELKRVLKPTGKLYLADFAPSPERPRDWIQRLHLRFEPHGPRTLDVATQLRSAGFGDVRESETRRVLFQPVHIYQATLALPSAAE